MSSPLTGAEFARLVRSMDPDEQALPIRQLVDLYDVPRCGDCGRHHDGVWEAIACDEFTDARRRRDAGRRARAPRTLRTVADPEEDEALL